MTESNQSKTLTIEKELPYPPDRIWRALTQPALITEWLMKNDFQPSIGHTFQFRANPMPQWNGVIDCEVLVVEPQKKLSYTWNSLGLESVVVWTLAATSTGTLLRLEQSGFRPDQEANYRGAQYGWSGFLEALARTCSTLSS